MTAAAPMMHLRITTPSESKTIDAPFQWEFISEETAALVNTTPIHVGPVQKGDTVTLEFFAAESSAVPVLAVSIRAQESGDALFESGGIVVEQETFECCDDWPYC